MLFRAHCQVVMVKPTHNSTCVLIGWSGHAAALDANLSVLTGKKTREQTLVRAHPRADDFTHSLLGRR
jgi:hypothetical protein